ncbi:esterase family protein [Plantactinospora sp. GCM10030261]|uniref:esterase family protein n=1 Tax=Plantactinospora sp. GCM10030261 TaxID=3273420 RepID=UPI00361A0633
MKASEQWFSERVQQPISMTRWGHYGTPVLLFPTAGGDAEEIERHHLVASCRHLLDAGRIKLYSCDSVAGRALATKTGTPAHRMWLLNQYQQAVAQEVVPAIHADLGGHRDPIVTAGASIGAFNAVAMLCRHPELFSAALGMSGTYRLRALLDDQFSDDLYFASAVHFVSGLDGPQLDTLRCRRVILASGEGSWEDIGESWALADALGAKGVPNRVDSWGPDFEHDWPTWRRMLPQYLEELC